MKRSKNNVLVILLLAGSVLGITFVCCRGMAQRIVSAEETTAVQSAAPVETEAPDVIHSPYIGENGVYAEWIYDEQTQCMTIRGNGETHSEGAADPRNGDGWDKFDTNEIPRLWKANQHGKVKEIKILDGVTAIGSAAFAYYHNLEKITIPDSVQSIGNYVFYECESLKEITIPDSVKSIGKECFFGCTALKKISIGKNVSDLGEAVFGECTSLSQITVNKENPYLNTKNGILYHISQKIMYVYYGNSTKNLTINKGIKKIGAFAFAKNKKLKTVRIPASVTEIGGGVFYRCTNLTKVVFAKKSKCKIIKNYLWSEGDDWAAYGSFQGCKKLKQLIFPDSLQYIDYICMKGCSSLKKIHFGKAFKGAVFQFQREKKSYDQKDPTPSYSLRIKTYSVSKGNKRFSSKDGVLYNKKKTRLLYYPAKKKLTKFNLPRSVRSIQSRAFYRCKNLKGLVIVRKNVKLEEDIFMECGKITIYGKRNSTSRKYAELNGMKFITIK